MKLIAENRESSDRNRATVAKYFDAVDEGDTERLLETFAQDAVYERPGYPALEGLHQLRHFYEEVRVIHDGRHEIEGIVVEADQGAAWGSFIGVDKDGAALEERWADAYEFRDGLIQRRRTHFFRPAV